LVFQNGATAAVVAVVEVAVAAAVVVPVEDAVLKLH